jgi:outer membrane receptor protein involved in Fe transport
MKPNNQRFYAFAFQTLTSCLIAGTVLAQTPANSAIEEVIVSGQKTAKITEMDLKTERLFSVAGAGLDPLASIQSLPGVSVEGGFGGSEPAVRGSAPSDNAYYIDHIPARYIFHIFGNSIFNKNLIHKFELFPAAFGNQYSNATGAVIDVELREPKQEPLTITANWSFLLSGGLIESQIGENQAFYASYRRSLIDKFADEKDVGDDEEGIEVNQLPISDDYQFKYLWQINERNKLSAVAAGASDEIAATFSQNFNAVQRDPDFAGPARIEQSFNSQGLTWDWVSDDQGRPSSLETILSLSQESDDFSYGTGQFFVIEKQRLFLKTRYIRQLNERHQLTLGLSQEQTDYDVDLNIKYKPCSEFDPDCPTVDAPLITYKQQLDIQTLVAYVQDEWQLTDKWYFQYGAHFSQDDYLKESALEPRLRLDYYPNPSWQWYLSAGQYSRTPDLAEILEETGNPELENLKSDHYVLGFKQDLWNGWSWTTDLYYKDESNLTISLSEGSDPDDYEKNYANDAEGQAYGIEFLIDKQMTEQWYGWIALSLSRSERTHLRTGETRKFSYDKPVILHFVGNYQLTEHWMLGMKWTFQSGNLYTPISSLKENSTRPEVLEPVYGTPYSERLPLYHRLDIRAEYKKPQAYGGHWSVFVDLLNAYDNDNVAGYQLALNGREVLGSQPDGFGADVPVREDLGIGIFPSIGFEVSF